MGAGHALEAELVGVAAARIPVAAGGERVKVLRQATATRTGALGQRLAKEYGVVGRRVVADVDAFPHHAHRLQVAMVVEGAAESSKDPDAGERRAEAHLMDRALGDPIHKRGERRFPAGVVLLPQGDNPRQPFQELAVLEIASRSRGRAINGVEVHVQVQLLERPAGSPRIHQLVDEPHLGDEL